MKINKYIDHTMLKADATREDIEKLCAEAREYNFASVCVNTCWVRLADELLDGSDVNVCTVVGFPLGAMATRAKAYEAEVATLDGADEIDMVINIGFIKSGMWKEAEEDIRLVKRATQGRLLKVILETCLLTKDEIVKACEISEKAGADYVKTSTGFSKGGATQEDVRLMRKTVGDRLGVKASGGIRDAKTAHQMIESGASRLGCSSGVEIMKGETSDGAY